MTDYLNSKQNKTLQIILYFISFAISVVPALFYTAPAFEDGLGTMATAAFLTGHNWSSFLAEDGYYYKYGQALWYIIPFLIIDNAVVRYKVMLAVNSMLTAFIPVLSFHISIKYMLVDKSGAFGISLLTGILPSVLLYNKYTWAETNLFLIPWLILLLMSELYDAVQCSVRKKVLYSAGIAALSVYAFMSHQRGIIILIASTIVILWIARCKKGNVSICAYAAVLTAGLAADRLISVWQKANVYAGAVLKHNTLADFLKPEIYQKLFTIRGMKAMLYPFIGWLYNCTCSTFGIAFIGLCFMLIAAVKCIRYKKIENVDNIAAVQGLLCFLGAFALGLLFFFQSSYGYLDGTQVERCDHLLFGRYLESSLPVLFYFGLIKLYTIEKSSKIFNLSLVLDMVMFLFAAVKLFPLMDGVDCYVHSLMSMNLFMDTSSVTKTQDIISNYTAALFLFGVLSAAASQLFRIIFQKRRQSAYLLLACLFLSIYIWNCVTVTGRVDEACATKYALYYLEN